MARKYTFTNGEELEYDIDDPELESYLSKVREAAQDPDVSSNELLDLIYSTDNPLMDSDVIPGRGVITDEGREHPAYDIMIDQLQIKRTQEGDFEGQETDGYGPSSGRYSMSVSEASDELDISTSAVRQAIYNDRLEARKRGGAWRLDLESVESYQVSDRGPNAAAQVGEPLDVVLGYKEGFNFSVAHDGEFELDERREGNVLAGTIRGWTQAAVKQNRKLESGDALTYLKLEPDDDSSSVQMDEFEVEGEFRISRVVSDNEEARETFQSFNEALPDD